MHTTDKKLIKKKLNKETADSRVWHINHFVMLLGVCSKIFIL